MANGQRELNYSIRRCYVIGQYYTIKINILFAQESDHPTDLTRR